MIGISSNQARPQNIYNKQKINFGRGLNDDERKISNLLLDRSFQINAVDYRAVVIPSAANPSYYMQGKDGQKFLVDTGVGAAFSKATQEQSKLLKDVVGINAKQHLPMGNIDAGNYSPFNGSAFEKGAHLIDPGQMLEMGLVSEQDVKDFSVPSAPRDSYWNNYENYFQKEKGFFEKAFDSFSKMDEASKVKKDYNEFLGNPVYQKWIDNKSITAALGENLYGDQDYLRNWGKTTKKANPDCKLELNPQLDKVLFAQKNSTDEALKTIAEAREKAILEDPACRKTIELFKFKQFLAYQQLGKMKEFDTAHNIKNIADVPIGCHISDTHSHQNAFMMDLNTSGSSEYGCWDKENSKFNGWGAIAVKPNNDAARDFIFQKYRNELEIFDTARIDAAWQLKSPFIQHQYPDNNEISKEPLHGQGYFPAVTDAFVDAKKGAEVQNIVAENLSEDADRVRITDEVLTEMNIPKIALDDTNVQPNSWVTRGIHDQPSLLSEGKDRAGQIQRFADMFKGQRGDIGPRKAVITFTDIFGRGDQYNVPSKSGTGTSNWKLRQPDNYEKFYFSQLANGYGLNSYKAVKVAMTDKGVIDKEGNSLSHEFAPDAKIVSELLDHFGQVVEDGKGEIFTTEAANAQGKGIMKSFHDRFGEQAAKLLVDGYETLANKADNMDGLKGLMLNVASAVEEHRKNQPEVLVLPETPAAVVQAENTAPNLNVPIAASQAENTAESLNVAKTTTQVENTAASSATTASKDAAKDISKEGKDTISKALSKNKKLAIGASVATGAVTALYLAARQNESAIRQQRLSKNA